MSEFRFIQYEFAKQLLILYNKGNKNFFYFTGSLNAKTWAEHSFYRYRRYRDERPRQDTTATGLSYIRLR